MATPINIAFLAQCSGCKKRKFFIKNRTYIPKGPPNVPITSQNMLCGRCFSKIIKMIENK